MQTNRVMLLTLTLAMVAPELAHAYVGPGAGITAIGAAIAFVGGMLLAIVGFVWYPIKRLFRALAGRRAKARTIADNPTE